jgi:anti-repressor protein
MHLRPPHKPISLFLHPTTIIDGKGNPWWVAKEVFEILELNNVTNALRALDDDEKADFTISKVRSDGVIQRRNRSIINEPGIYALVFRSRKPEAMAFKRWITHTVIPEIRRTGCFLHATAEMTDEEIMTRGLEVSKKKIDELRGRVQDLLPKAEAFDHFIGIDTLINQQPVRLLQII